MSIQILVVIVSLLFIFGGLLLGYLIWGTETEMIEDGKEYFEKYE